MYVCSCFGITEAQVMRHADDGRRTPRAIAGACRAGTDCGGCVKRIQALLGRAATPVPATAPVSAAAPVPATALASAATPVPVTAPAAVPCPVHAAPAEPDVARAA